MGGPKVPPGPRRANLLTLQNRLTPPDAWEGFYQLTGSQGGGRDLDLAGRLVGLEGRGSASGAEVGGEQVGALSPRGAGAGPIAAVVGLLLLVHGYQLREAEGDLGHMSLSDRKQRVNTRGRCAFWDGRYGGGGRLHSPKRSFVL